MRIPYCFLDENHFPSGESCYFEDEPGIGKYLILLARTRSLVNGYTFLRDGTDIAEAEHNLWQALWSVFAKLPDRPCLPCPPESEWASSGHPSLFIEFDDSEGQAA